MFKEVYKVKKVCWSCDYDSSCFCYFFKSLLWTFQSFTEDRKFALTSLLAGFISPSVGAVTRQPWQQFAFVSQLVRLKCKYMRAHTVKELRIIFVSHLWYRGHTDGEVPISMMLRLILTPYTILGRQAPFLVCSSHVHVFKYICVSYLQSVCFGLYWFSKYFTTDSSYS